MATGEVKSNLKEAHRLIKRAQLLLDFPINATPSGDLRNRMTDINIHVMSANSACADVLSKMEGV